MMVVLYQIINEVLGKDFTCKASQSYRVYNFILIEPCEAFHIWYIVHKVYTCKVVPFLDTQLSNIHKNKIKKKKQCK